MASRVITLEGSATRWAFLLIAACALTAYSWQAAQPWRAAQHARHLTEPELAKAMVLQPGDAAYANMLGRYFFFARQDTAAALPYFRNATELNRGVGRYWLDLAAAYHVENDANSEREALRHAAEAEPRNPETLWETANYWLAQGELETAMQQFRAILESDEYADAALQICWRATHDVNRVDALLNASTARQAQFLRVLGQTRELDAAGAEWDRIATAGRTVELPLVTPYVEALIETRQLDQATQVWHRLLELNGIAGDYVAADNLVENSSFEQPLLNSGFDWRRIPLPAVFVSLDSLAFHSGRQALFFQFDNSQDSDLGVWQLVRVAPGQHYRFSAWVRSEEVVGAHVPRVAVEDASSAAPLFLSDAAAGSSAWHEIEGEFTTASTASAVRIHLVRTPPATAIEGRLWIDDVTITAE